MPAYRSLNAKDMPDSGAHFGFVPLRLFLCFAQEVASRAFFPDLAFHLSLD
jgi:hypothetical protein